MSNDFYGATSPGYGAAAEMHSLTLGERLRTYYEDTDFVTVQNTDIRPITYQFAAPGDIETYSAYPGDKNTVVKRPPSVITLEPGQTKLCPAYEADLMIENLIKQITSRKVADDVTAGKVKPWSTAKWLDPNIQKKLIEEIFIGKEDVLATYNEGLNVATAKTS
jgi:hypothetical protein